MVASVSLRGGSSKATAPAALERLASPAMPERPENGYRVPVDQREQHPSRPVERLFQFATRRR
jgi:hypothetical protein